MAVDGAPPLIVVGLEGFYDRDEMRW